MRFVIAAALALLVFSVAAVGTAEAKQGGNPCNDFATAQTSDGQQIFDSKSLCKRHEGELFHPTATITPNAVGAGQQFTLSATGFHADAALTVYFAITGQDPYGSYAPYYPTNADGSFSIPFVFAECGNAPDDLTLLLVDSFGVHASAQLTLC